MMERQIERPSPSPSGLLVMKGSKIDSSLSAANDFASALGDCGDVSHRAAHLLKIELRCVEQTPDDVGVGEDPSEWLR